MIYILIIIYSTGHGVAIDHIEFNSSTSCEITASAMRKVDSEIQAYCTFKG
jgi:hypothetical protein